MNRRAWALLSEFRQGAIIVPGGLPDLGAPIEGIEEWKP